VVGREGRNLAGFNAAAHRVTGKGGKEVRADPFVPRCQDGNVWPGQGPWVCAFLEEAEPWPFGRTKDQIDACAMAFTHLNTAPVIYYGKAFE
jgi:phage terminase large subunit-like protein